MDNDGAGGGRYFDPSPGTAANPDDSEFDVILSPYAANSSVNPNSGRPTSDPF